MQQMAQDAFHQHAIAGEFGFGELPGPLPSWGAQFGGSTAVSTAKWGTPTGCVQCFAKNMEIFVCEL